MYAHVWEVNVYVSIRRLKVNVKGLSLQSLTNFVCVCVTKTSSKIKAKRFGYTGWPMSFRIHLVALPTLDLPQTGVTGTNHHAWVLHESPGSKPEAPRLLNRPFTS